MKLKMPLRDAQQEEPERICPVCGAELADDQVIYMSGWEAIGCSECVTQCFVRDFFG